MIIEAFSRYLQSADPELPAISALGRWLWERLSMPPENQVDKVLHCEVAIAVARRNSKETLYFQPCDSKQAFVFKARSESGRRLLNALYQYATSYEQQKWSRWVHKIKASDFNRHADDR